MSNQPILCDSKLMVTTKTTRKKAPAPAKSAQSGKKVAPKAGGNTVGDFLASMEKETQADCRQLNDWMHAATGGPGVMYGKSIIGYGTAVIRHADGREAPWMKIGFSPRKLALALYGVISSTSGPLLENLGKHSTEKGCLYVERLADVDETTLRALLVAAAA
jgi:hypothetical protein